MKILLTGAGGSVGYQTLQELAKTDYEITVLDLPSRKNRRRLGRFRHRAQVAYGSVNDVPLVDRLVGAADAVIHLAAVIPPLADRNPGLAEQVNVGGTQAIVDAIRRHGNRCFLIYSSSISVYGDRLKDCWITVDDPLRPSEGDEYALTKIKAEDLVRAAGIPYTIFRFSAIMGRPETDPLMFNMPLDTPLEIASTWNTAEALVGAVAKRDELCGRTFNLGGGPGCRTTYREFLGRMFEIYGLKFGHMPEGSFAQKNFHCGWYADSAALEDILHFQHDDLESYYQAVRRATNPVVRFFTRLFSRPIIRMLIRNSEPYHARKNQDATLIRRFFDNGIYSNPTGE